MRSIELFAGAGGLALGLERAGAKTLMLVDADKHCCAALRANRSGWYVRHAKVEHVADWPSNVDLVAGSPPCQPFSPGGASQGVFDPRNGWPVFVRAVKHIRPRFVVAENVPAMLRDEHVGYLSAIRDEIAKVCGWADVWELNAADYGVPQDRNRVFVVGAPKPLYMPNRTHTKEGASLFGGQRWVSVREALELPKHASGIRRGHGFLPDRIADLDAPSSTVLATAFGIGTDLRINEAAGLTEREVATAGAGRKDAYGFMVGRPPDGWRWKGSIANDGMRRPTEAEIAVLMGFPAEWKFTGRKTTRCRQRGNAVCPAVAEAVGRQLMRCDS